MPRTRKSIFLWRRDNRMYSGSEIFSLHLSKVYSKKNTTNFVICFIILYYKKMLNFFSQGILVNLSIWKDASCLSCGFLCHICMSPRVLFRSVRSILRQGNSLKGLNRRVRKVTAAICALLKICSKRNLTSVCFFLCTPMITSNL